MRKVRSHWPPLFALALALLVHFLLLPSITWWRKAVADGVFLSALAAALAFCWCMHRAASTLRALGASVSGIHEIWVKSRPSKPSDDSLIVPWLILHAVGTPIFLLLVWGHVYAGFGAGYITGFLVVRGRLCSVWCM